MGSTAAAPTADTTPLALKYRPRRLSEIVGQRHVTVVLGRAIATGRMPQQLLFSGSSGLGKTTVARAAAAAVLCTTPLSERDGADGSIVGDACGHCENCLDVTSPDRTHPDVIEFDAASHGGKDDIRDIAARAATAPMRAHRKIYIIDEAHGLTAHGGQAFLKLLEEPPAHVMFMLATTDPQKMLATNRGRCVEFEMLRPTDAEIAARLVDVAASEGWTISPETAEAVIDATDTKLGLRGALMTLSKLAPSLAWGLDPTPDELAELLAIAPPQLSGELFDAAVAGDVPTALARLDTARRTLSDAAIRRGLLHFAHRRWRAVASDPSAEPMARARLEQIAGAPAGELWTDLILAQLRDPVTPSTTDRLEQLLEQASSATATLDPAQPAAPAAPAPRQHRAEPARSSRPASRPASPATPAVASSTVDSSEPLPSEPPPDADEDGPPPDRSTTKPAQAASAQEQTATTPASAGVSIDAVIAECSTKVAAQMLRSLAGSGAAVITGNRLTITPPKGMGSSLPRQQAVLATAAQAVGLELVVTS